MIAGGFLKGKSIDTLSKQSHVRPISSKLRQAMFDVIIHNNIKMDYILDAFAGTGIVGIEAISMGSKHAYFFEIDLNTAKHIRSSIKKLDIANRSSVLCSNILYAKHHEVSCDIAFIDPPYSKEDNMRNNTLARTLKVLLNKNWINDESVLIYKTHKKYLPDFVEIFKTITSGDSVLYFCKYKG